MNFKVTCSLKKCCLIIFLIITTFNSCSTSEQKETITLKDWLEEEENFKLFSRAIDATQKDCENLKNLSNDFQIVRV